jgi:MYXO-CTERM domain-containing protein
MVVRRVLAASLCLFALLATTLAAEGRASACITSAGCSGLTPTCDLLSFSCRACQSDVECGAPLSGDICLESGAKAGSCVSAADAGPRNCSVDSECDTLAGYVCSGITCVAGCHLTVFGDTCLVGARCVFPIGISVSIGNCSPVGGDDGGGVGDGGGGAGDAGKDASPPGCSTDADCDPGSGRVCDHGANGQNACVPGCHETEAGDTCPPGTMCSVVGGGLGVCRAPVDGGTCINDSDCHSPGLVCVGDSCVVGCRDTDAGDSCPAGATCSVRGGGLGICVGPGVDGGTAPCTRDHDCLPGQVCEGDQCVTGCRDSDAGDSCPAGASCSALDGGVGVCSSSSPDGGTGGCTRDQDCNGGLVCVGDSCVVGCRDTDAGTDTCLLGTGGECRAGDAGIGQCVGMDGGVTPGCTVDADCAHGLVCDGMQCVVGCHDTSAAGDTCDAGSTCSVVGGGLGVCNAQGPDGGPTSCTQDLDCPQGQVCDQAMCVIGCHQTASGDSCPLPLRCDALGGSLGICIGPAGDGGGAASDDASEPSDASGETGDATIGPDSGGGNAESFAGGGCGCSSSPNSPAEGGGLVLLLAVTVLVRRRVSK